MTRLSGQAIVWDAPGASALAPITAPPPGCGEITIAIACSVVSPGTERAQYLRLPNARVGFPHTPGYSAAGTVLAVGEDVGDLSPGDRVAAHVPHASIATVARDLVVKIPDGLTLEAAATVTLGVIAALGPRCGGLRPGEPLVVVGAGPVGLLAQRLAAAAGAGPATLLCRSPRKRPLAERGGAELLACGLDDARIAAVGAPLVIDATGTPASLDVAVAAAGEEARIVLLGSARGAARALPAAFSARRLRLVGAHVSNLTAGEHAALAADYLQLLASGAVDVADLIARTVDPRAADALYAELADTTALLLPILDWRRLEPRELPRHPGPPALPAGSSDMGAAAAERSARAALREATTRTKGAVDVIGSDERARAARLLLGARLATEEGPPAAAFVDFSGSQGQLDAALARLPTFGVAVLAGAGAESPTLDLYDAHRRGLVVVGVGDDGGRMSAELDATGGGAPGGGAAAPTVGA